MTDKPDPETIDIAAIVASYFTEQAERNRRAGELRPANKTALFDALAAAGITQVVVTFDGCGDSGQIEEIDARSEDDMVPLPPDEIMICSAAWGDPGFVARTMTVEQAIEQLAYDFLSETHGGWENDDGAYGEFTFDVATRSISLDYNERFTSSEYYGHEF